MIEDNGLELVVLFQSILIMKTGCIWGLTIHFSLKAPMNTWLLLFFMLELSKYGDLSLI